jgi:small redox-active disulfide protein 2
MKIEVLGSGCPTCHKLFELTQKAVEEMKLQVEVEYIDDIQKILEMGVMSVPVLVIDGKVAMSGSLPSVERIKEVLSSSVANEVTETSVSCCSDKKNCNEDCRPNENGASGCSCGGNC